MYWHFTVCGIPMLPPLLFASTRRPCVVCGCHGKPWFFVPKTALTDLSFWWVSSVVQTFFGLQTGWVLAASISIVCSFCVSVCVALLSPLSCTHDFTVTICSLKSQSVVIKLQQLHAALHRLEVSRSNRSRASAVHFFRYSETFSAARHI